MPKMTFNDVTIHYQEAGSGPFAYVMCHGLGASGDGFIEEFPFWTEYFGRALSWDVRGIGHSSNPDKYSLPLYANDLDRLLTGLGVERVVVYGVSWGGILAQQFALDYPSRCIGLIIDSSSSEANLTASEYWYSRGEIAKEHQKQVTRNPQPPIDQDIPKGLGKPNPSTIRTKDLDSFVAMARVAAGLREHPLTPRLRSIECPTLIIGGGKDSLAGAGGSVIMSRNLPNATLEIFQEAGHGVARTNVNEFRALVLDFCRKHDLI